MVSERYCPYCEYMTEHVLVQYDPAPNDAQVESDDIPTDELRVAGADVCCECGNVIEIHPKPESGEVEAA